MLVLNDLPLFSAFGFVCWVEDLPKTEEKNFAQYYPRFVWLTFDQWQALYAQSAVWKNTFLVKDSLRFKSRIVALNLACWTKPRVTPY